MNNTPLVSIIIPTYNRAHLIGETLDSVRNQTYQNWECIVVDDGSKDDTEEVMRHYNAQDSRIKFTHNKRKKGAPGARNTGLEKAGGELIAFFDSDDLMLPNFIEIKFGHFINNSSLDWVISNGVRIGSNGEKNYINVSTNKQPIIRFFSLNPFVDIPWLTPSLIKKDFLINNCIEWDENLNFYQDIHFNLQLLFHNPNFLWLDKIITWHWIHRLEISRIGNKKKDNFLVVSNAMNLYFSFYKDSKFREKFIGRLNTQFLYQIALFYDNLIQEGNEFSRISPLLNQNKIQCFFDKLILVSRINSLLKAKSLNKKHLSILHRLLYKLRFKNAIKENNFLKTNLKL